MSGIGAESGAVSPSTGQQTLGVLDDARVGDLSTLFTLATLHVDMYWQEDEQGRCTGLSLSCPAANDVAHKLAGSSLGELLLAPGPDAADEQSIAWNTYQAARAKQQPFRQVALTVDLDQNNVRHLRVSGVPQYDDQQRFLGYHCLARDMTEDRLAEQRHLRFREAIDMSTDMIYLVDRASLKFLDINTSACTQTGYSLEQLMAMSPADAMGFKEEELTARYDHLIRSGTSSLLERRVRTRDGKPMVIEVHSRAININGRWIIIGISRDVTERKQTETRILRLQQLFSALSTMNEAILRTDDIASLYQDVCDAAVSVELFTLAIIHTPENDYDFAIAATAGQLITDTYSRPMLGPELPEGQGVVGLAYRTQKPVWTDDYQNDERTRPWHDLGRELGIGSGAALPLFQRKQCVAVMVFYAPRRGLFDSEILAILQSMVDNISFRLDAFASEEEQARAAAVIRENEQRFRSLTTLSSDFYWEKDKDLRFVKYEGRAIGDSNIRAVDDLIGRKLWQMSGISPDSMDWNSFRRLLQQEKKFRDFEFSFTNEDNQTYHYALSGEPILDDEGNFQGYRGISRDITENKHVANHIKYLATHDTLTSLPNRVMFHELLRQTTLNAKRYKEQAFAMLFLDLDQFKEINDTYGHHVGDLLLTEVAQRLRAPLRKSDVVARLGGDEFVIILQRVSDPQQAVQIANNILRSLAKPVTVNGLELQISGSIGLSLYGVDATDEDTLMNHADTAMYAAKESGPNQVRVYSSDLQKLSEDRANLSVLLRRAFERDELSLHYQVQMDVASNRPIAVEALLRWHHPQLGDIPPGIFVPLAEENGLIPGLGKWALKTACQQVMDWRSKGLCNDLKLAVNLSARQFNDADLVDEVRGILVQTGFPADQLGLELTESLVAQSPERAVVLMQAIKDLGVRFALDDFGTGYSSLAQLRHYPLDILKIDQSFVRDLTESHQSRAIFQAIIAMARALDLTVVAEGVESQEQLDLLREFGCDQAQGSLFLQPVPPDEFVAWYCSAR